MSEDILVELEDTAIELTVDGIDYTVVEEGENSFAIMDGEENFAEVSISCCGDYYQYDYSPLYASFDNCSGVSPVNNHDGIKEFFKWVIATNEG